MVGVQHTNYRETPPCLCADEYVYICYAVTLACPKEYDKDIHVFVVGVQHGNGLETPPTRPTYMCSRVLHSVYICYVVTLAYPKEYDKPWCGALPQV